MRHVHSRLLTGRVFSLMLIMSMVFFLLLLAACGTNAGGTTTGSGSAASPTAPLTTQKCGVVHTMRLNIVPADQNLVKGVEDCFWHAFQQCRPATMTYSQSDLDTGTLHNFSIKNENGKCTITDGMQHFIAPRPPQSTTNYTCTGLQQQADGLHFLSCGTLGNILIPQAGI